MTEYDESKQQNILLEHVILPRVLPQEKQSFIYERNLISEMIENVQNLSAFLPHKTVEMMKRLDRVNDECTPTMISQQINGLHHGDTFSMFIRRQNTAIMFHVPTHTELDSDGKPVDIIVATFPGCLNPRKIQQYESDIEFNYPVQAFKVKFSKMLRSEQFANQLSLLHEDLPAESPENRDYISKWLITLLTDEKSQRATTDEFPIILKKIRDEVLGKMDKNYFRRSSYYISVKVMLQHNLTMQYDDQLGTLVYKIVMLNFLVGLCAIYEEPDCNEFDIDLMPQMIAKMARRIDKLQRKRPITALPENITQLHDNVIAEAKRTIKTIRGVIETHIKVIQDEDTKSAQLPTIVGLNFEADICYKMPKLLKHLQYRSREVPQIQSHSKRSTKSYQRSYKQGSRRPIKIESTDESSDRMFWTDTENFILYDMGNDDDFYLYDYGGKQEIFDYVKYAEKAYKRDPVMLSRMMLVMLKIIFMVDQRLTAIYPMLKQHHSGINSNIISNLLLKQRIDMDVAFELEEYFRERNENASDPALLEHSFNDSSFAVKYARQNHQMCQLRDEIQQLDKQNVSEMERKLTNGRREAENLREQAERMNCLYRINRINQQYHAKPKCERCRLRTRANAIRHQQYEHLLPTREQEQFGVVFELRIPEEIGLLRDLLFAFNRVCTSEKFTESLSIQGNWATRKELWRFSHSASNRFVTLGSTTSRRLVEHHVDYPDGLFIISNSFNCVFHVDKKAIPTSIQDTGVRKMLSFEMQNEYKCLQWTADSKFHTQNQVFALQSKCPQTELTLSEFKSFGSLRADGHRLQLRKLYAMIETAALSFEKESVLLLIMQVLWQCGVSGYGGSIREAHIDFNDPEFCQTMIELLENFIEKNKDNWMHPIKLLMVTLIAVRMFEINDTQSVANEIEQRLLKQIRAIAVDWIDKINHSINQNQNLNGNEENKLRLKLMYAAIIGAVTFCIQPQHKYFDLIKSNDVAMPQFWLNFIITLNTNIHLYESNEDCTTGLPSTIRIFKRLIEIGGIHLERTMHEIITRNKLKVYPTIAKHWSNARNAKDPVIYFDAEFQHILIVEVRIKGIVMYFDVDIITGEFSINGQPLSRLPPEMTKNQMYRRFFGKASLAVQTNAQNHFSTVHSYNNFTYEFREYNQQLIITERRSDDFVREMIFHEIFEGDFPDALVWNYNHWWNKRDNCIEFQRYQSIGQSTDADIDYRLELNSRHLIHSKTERCMLDIASNGFQKIINHLARLEHHQYIHVLLENSQVAIVELLRMKLKFKLDCSKVAAAKHGYQLQSIEFNGMCVSLNQKVGTLYGLNHGLVLESCPGKSALQSKILLIPHGRIHVNDADQHVSVDIDIFEIQNPPFYKYQVDERLQQLKSTDGSHSSWFYLAYLHAITSHQFVEPFLGMSGTERALQILQSAFCWSSSPYDPEALKILIDYIAKLSPCRKKINFHLSVKWPSIIPKHCAQDSYIFIVKKLIEDSRRLHGLYSDKNMPKFEIESHLSLNQRDYWRCLQLQPNLRVSDEFIEQKILKTSLPKVQPISFSANVQTVSMFYHNQTYQVPVNLDLKAFLTKENSLQGPSAVKCISNILCHGQYDKLRNLWIRLYDVARKEEWLNREEFALTLSLFAHQNVAIEPILALQAVAQNAEKFKFIEPPLVDTFQISAGTYNRVKVSECLENHYPRSYLNYFSFNRSTSDSTNDENVTRSEIIDDLTAKITQSWPCDSVDLSTMCTYENINQEFLSSINTINRELNDMLSIWYNNYRLYEFISEIENGLKSLDQPRINQIAQFHPFKMPIERKWTKYAIDIDAIAQKCLNEFKIFIDEAKRIWTMDIEQAEVSRSSIEWWTIIKQIFETDVTSHLVHADLIERMVPSLILPKILNANEDADFRALIGAWAITIAHDQYKNRAVRRPGQKDLATARELENKPHTNWKPCERPEWLLFEIEQNLTIRQIQIEIAERMISPPNNDADVKHSVMQLNMGEGKTAVIVPTVAAVLANGNQACQITVLKSLFARNLVYLRQYLGGLLNRRFYIFPCRRDMDFNRYIEEILKLYEECRMKKGIILTLPEYRLSMQLKIYESIQKCNFKLANNFLKVYKWGNENIRNILDESDAILQPNYQLIYTMGKPLSPDGGEARWLVTQAVFKRIPHRMKLLYQKYGKEKIEFDDNIAADVTGQQMNIFPKCRILDETIFEHLRAGLIDDFLNAQIGVNVKIVEPAKPWLKKMLSEKEIDTDTFQKINNYSDTEQDVIMILSGLLRLEVLKLALIKRWRVNYGIDPNGERKMAIPFRAKDVAAEKSEFGHPDVAICFTQISYYLSGLSVPQLHQLFAILEKEKEPDRVAIYEGWIKDIEVHPSIQSYKDINLDDSNQRDNHLFPLLRLNMYAIDFWLNKIVYPHESKIFEQKLMSTPWDLCSEHLQHCVTGFSGTNDTKNILPMPIAQNDLPKLENTNEKMREILLRPENQSYDKLSANVSGIEIVKRLIEQKIPVLLDSGALMLELSNKEVAVKWLEMISDPCFEAAVYFDKNDVLQTIDRNGIMTEFDSSVYRENLNRCLVYMDDVHTRGTDLKFPMGWKACVTLSGDITRDKTVQSCMRMRQLGHHHSICFWASYEADIRIRNVCELSAMDRITNEHVIKFVHNNSCEFESKNMTHWTVSALNYSKKLVAHKLYGNAIEAESMAKLYNNCVDDEFIKLKQTYGDKKQALLQDIVWSKFDMFISRFKTYKDIRSYLKVFQDKVFDKLVKQAANVIQFSNALDEEQEKELEQEQEEQRMTERPPVVTPAEPDCDKRLEELTTNGVTDYNVIEQMIESNALYSLGASLKRTKLFRPFEQNVDAWADHLFVTQDFVRVLADKTSKACDLFLRPVWWIASISNNDDKNILLLLSTYEAEQLLPIFRESTKSTLFMYWPRLSKYHRNLLNDSKLQITGIDSTQTIDLDDIVQIGMYACSMYFDSEEEQKAYCAFMGLVPSPRTPEQNAAVTNRLIKLNGYVPIEYRQHPYLIASGVSKSKFKSDPIKMAIELIEARNQTIPKESHVAWILEQSKIQTIEHVNGVNNQ